MIRNLIQMTIGQVVVHNCTGYSDI